MSARFCAGQSQGEPETGIEGRIALSPVPPKMNSEAVSESTPLGTAPFVVTNKEGLAASFATDEDGRFRVSVAAGHYRVSQQDNKSRIRRCGPWEVDVVAGKMTKVEWYCETGGTRLDMAPGSENFSKYN